MGDTRWDPSLLRDPTDASRELAQHLRFLLDREGLTPRQLAAETDVPYSPAMLYRFFSGRALPPPQLIEVVAHRCKGDLEGLQNVYDRALRAGMVSFTGANPQGRTARKARQPGQHAKKHESRLRLLIGQLLNVRRPRLVTAGVGFSAVGAIALAATAVHGIATEPTSASEATGRQAPSAVSGVQQPPAPAPNPEDLIPAPSSRRSSAKQKPKATPKPSKSATENREAAPQQAVSLVANGTFTGTIAPWQSTPGATVTAADNRLRVGLPRSDGDNGPGGVIVSSSQFALESGRSYTLRFDAGANEEAPAVVMVQSQGGTPANVLTQVARLNGATQSFVFGFTTPANTAPPAVLSFQFAAQEERYSATLDNVSITPS